MKLLLDEMLSPEIARQLKSKGHDVEAIKGHPEWRSLSDPEVMDLARDEKRAVVTDNLLDFRSLHHEAISPGGGGHFGMVFMPGGYRRSKADTGRIVRGLEEKLSEFPAEGSLANAETWLLVVDAWTPGSTVIPSSVMPLG